MGSSEDRTEVQQTYRLLKALHLVTGLPAYLLTFAGGTRLVYPGDEDYCSYCSGVQSTRLGRERCQRALQKGLQIACGLGEAYIFRCYAGLVEIVAPIASRGETVAGNPGTFDAAAGNLLDLAAPDEPLGIATGGFLMWHLDELALEELVLRARPVGLDRGQVLRLARGLRYLTSPKVQAIADMITAVSLRISPDAAPFDERRQLQRHQQILAAQIHSSKEEEAIRHTYPLEKERELLGRVRVGDKTGAREILNQILGEILLGHAARPEIVKARVLELVVMLSRAAVEGGAKLEKLLGLNYGYVEEVAACESLEQVCLWCVKVLDVFLEEVYKARGGRRLGVLMDAVEYVREHYEADLTLEDVASAVHISPYYLSHLFSEELGITFVEFLTRTRVEAAKKLLADPRLTIQQIARKCGYSDASYFTKVFKKVEGRTPTQYRA